MKQLTFSLIVMLFTFAAQAQIKFYNVVPETGMKIIPASLYNARPNDGISDKKAMKYLIRKVSAMPNSFILLEPGKYDIDKIRIEYDILQDMHRTEETTPVPEGYVKMYYIFLVPESKSTQIAKINKY